VAVLARIGKNSHEGYYTQLARAFTFLDFLAKLSGVSFDRTEAKEPPRPSSAEKPGFDGSGSKALKARRLLHVLAVDCLI
jgi:hypothetical protein